MRNDPIRLLPARRLQVTPGRLTIPRVVSDHPRITADRVDDVHGAFASAPCLMGDDDMGHEIDEAEVFCRGRSPECLTRVGSPDGPDPAENDRDDSDN